MSPPNATSSLPTGLAAPVVREQHIEYGFLGKLQGLKCEYRPDITDRASLEKNFRENFDSLNRVRLTDSEFARLLDEVITPDVFAAAKTLREINTFTRDDDTPLNYTLVNLKNWCKNHFEVVHQLRINKDLHRQTPEEFNRFQEGCVEEKTNTAALVRRLLSEDYADKVIVTTIQKLGLALDENSKRNKQRSKNGQSTYKEHLEALKDKRIVFIFDECHHPDCLAQMNHHEHQHRLAA